MSRFSWIVASLIVSAPLMMSNLAQAAPKKGGGSRPAASHAAPARSHAAPARSSNVHPGTARANTPHTRTAPATNAHMNGVKAGHSQNNAGKSASHSNAGKNGMHNNNGKNGGGQRNFPARGHRGFTNSNWLPDFGAWTYFNPDDATWYYWYEPSDMFLPVSYINDYRPVATTPNTDNGVNAPTASTTSTTSMGLLSRP